MLTTQQEHALPSFPFAAGTGVTTWRAATLHLGTPYVFVQYAIKQGRDWLVQTTIFWRHEDVIDFCRATNKEKKRKLSDIFMLVPATYELDHKWTYVPIRKIYVVEESEEDYEFPIYVTDGGEVVSGLGFVPSEDAPACDHQDLEEIYSAR